MLKSTATSSWTWWVWMIYDGCPFFFTGNCSLTQTPFYRQNKDGSYTGFVKVQFKLARPVSVPPPKKGRECAAKKGAAVKRRTSFYLPKDASKYLHISSRTSSREVIEALLKKFTVVDNPGKFALFERSERHDQGKTQFLTGKFCKTSCSSEFCMLNRVSFCSLQFTFASCLTTSAPSVCVWPLDPMRKCSALFWRRMRLEKSM